MIRKTTRATLLLLVTVLIAAAPDAKNLLKPTNLPATWRLEQHESAKAEISVDGDAIVVDTKETDSTDWHVQAIQMGLDLAEGKEYVLTFKAKAAADRSVPVNANIDQDDWHAIGLSETADLTTDWKDFKYEFKAEQTLKAKNRVGFILGNDKGKVWIKEMVLTEK